MYIVQVVNLIHLDMGSNCLVLFDGNVGYLPRSLAHYLLLHLRIQHITAIIVVHTVTKAATAT